MGQGNTTNINRNVLVVGVTTLVQLDKIDASWKKDEGT
jgi:hypothetical protein